MALPPFPSFNYPSNGGSDGRSRIPPYPDGERHYDFNNKIMLASIVSLSAVVVVVSLLHIYVRWILRRQARRAAALHRLGLVARAANESSQPPPKTGLDPSVIAALPTLVFRKPDPAAQGENSISECAVCLSLLEDEEVFRLLPNCNHSFHAECIDKWLASHSTCPNCRTEVQPRAPTETPEQTATLPPSAPALERPGSVAVSFCMEGTSSSDAAGVSSPHKRSGSMTRLSSFRRMLSRERSSRGIQPVEVSVPRVTHASSFGLRTKGLTNSFEHEKGRNHFPPCK
ncbi:hypothetical protein SAY87_027257 [Trapa incisa]|uniref:RING-type E3 ubiquitin transferase n=1 Tax=Trapa incisa TaxID=236973 RepID=A0AAN7GZ20_9MYRT|nr:hypothetical protein SAY87_027257 [Trapa incisa]